MSGLPGAPTAEARALLQAALRTGPLEIRARGASMRPWLRSGDRVRLETRSPKRGDVALVALPDALVLHRLVRRRGSQWLVRGDARPGPDGWVTPDDVLAIAVAHRRARGGPWRRLDHVSARQLGLWLARGVRAARSLVHRTRAVRALKGV